MLLSILVNTFMDKLQNNHIFNLQNIIICIKSIIITITYFLLYL